MSYTLDLIVGSLSSHNEEAWKQIAKLRKAYYDDDREKAPQLVALHGLLTAKYPCLCSYAAMQTMMKKWRIAPGWTGQ